MYATFLFDPAQLNLVSPVPVVNASGQPTADALPVPTPKQNGDFASISLAAAFSQLAEATRNRMLACEAQQLSVPATYCQRGSTNGKFLLSAEAWNIQVGQLHAQLRLVKIDGAKSNIINAWIFPIDPRRNLVYAAELIGVGESVRVAFVDVQSPCTRRCSNRISLRLSGLAKGYSGLPCDEPAPGWAVDASLGHYTYARNVPAASLSAIQGCYLDYLDLYLSSTRCEDWLADCGDSLEQARGRLHAYQLHHMQHSPGKKFLGNLFGVDWTERFMLDFLFTLP